MFLAAASKVESKLEDSSGAEQREVEAQAGESTARLKPIPIPIPSQLHCEPQPQPQRKARAATASCAELNNLNSVARSSKHNSARSLDSTFSLAPFETKLRREQCQCATAAAAEVADRSHTALISTQRTAPAHLHFSPVCRRRCCSLACLLHVSYWLEPRASR